MQAQIATKFDQFIIDDFTEYFYHSHAVKKTNAFADLILLSRDGRINTYRMIFFILQ